MAFDSAVVQCSVDGWDVDGMFEIVCVAFTSSIAGHGTCSSTPDDSNSTVSYTYIVRYGLDNPASPRPGAISHRGLASWHVLGPMRFLPKTWLWGLECNGDAT